MISIRTDSKSFFQHFSSRSETVSKLAELVDSQDVVYVRGTPASGKNNTSRSTATIFRRYGKDRGLC